MVKQNSSKRKVVGVLYAAALVIGFVLLGGTAEAALPEPYGVNQVASCVAPVISNFTPYIYDGELHSFEYTVNGSESPLVVAVVGERGIEYRYSTQRKGNGASRVHVDVPGWYGFTGEMRVVVSVLTGADAHCWSAAEFHVKLAGPTKVPTDTTKETLEVPTPPKNVIVIDSAPLSGEHAGSVAVVPKDKDQSVKSKEESLTRSMVATIGSFFGSKVSKDECKTLPRTAWIALAIVCLVAILIVIDRLPYLLKGNGVKFAIVLLAVFVVMLGIWFIFDRCRSYRWFPIVVTVLTLLTLITPTALDTKKLRK